MNPDGTRTLEDHGSPIRVKNEDGSWSNVDFDLQKQPDGTFAPKVSATDISIGDGGTDPAAQVTFDDGSQINVKWPNGALPAPMIDGGVATYQIDDTVDLVTTVVDGGISTTIRFNEKPSQADRDLALTLKAQGLQISETAQGGLQASDRNGERVGRGGGMIAWDSRTDEAGDPLKVVSVDADLTTTEGIGFNRTQELALTAPDAFLDDPSTVYPVTVDPDISSVARVRDTYVRNGVTTSNGSSYALAVGAQTNNTQNPAVSYMQYDTSAISGKVIVRAHLNLLQYHAYSCQDRQMNIAPIAEAWVDAVTWANRPAGRWGTGDEANVYNNLGASGCAPSWLTPDVTNMVKAWTANEYPNYGFRLGIPAASETYPSFERRFCSMNPNSALTYCNTVNTKPYLSITYNSHPNTPSALAVTPLAPNPDGGTSQQIETPMPTLSAVVSDPDGGTSRARFNIYSGSTLVWYGDGSAVTNGGTSSVTVPAGELLRGETYMVKAYGYDGTLFSRTTSSSTGFCSSTFQVSIEGPGSGFVSTPGVIVFDTIDSGALGPTSSRPFQVGGIGGVPATGVAAVVLNVTVKSSSLPAPGSLTLWPNGQPRPVATSVSFDDGVAPLTNTVIVPMGSDGKVAVFNELGSVHATVTTQGYFAGGSSSSAFTPVAMTLLDTTNSIGTSLGAFAGGESRKVRLPSTSQVPAGTQAVFANLEVTNSAADGTFSLLGGSSDPAQAEPTMTYVPGETRSVGVMVPVDANGDILVNNSGLGPADVRIDLQGAFSSGSVLGFHVVNATNLLDTELSGAKIPANGTIKLQVTGQGIPKTGVDVVAVSVTAAHWDAPGGLKVYPTDTLEPEGPQLRFSDSDASAAVSSTAFVPTGSYGSITVHNDSSAPIDVRIALQGWFNANSTQTQDRFGIYNPIDSAPIYTSLTEPETALGIGEHRSIKVAGLVGIPSETADIVASAVFVRVTAFVTTTPSLTLNDTASLDTQAAAVTFRGSTETTATGSVAVPIADDGTILVTNSGTAPVDFELAAQGWYTLSKAIDDGQEATPADEPTDDTVPDPQQILTVSADASSAEMQEAGERHQRLVKAGGASAGQLTNSFKDYDAVTWRACGMFTDKDKSVRKFGRRYYFRDQVGGYVTLRCGSGSYGFRHVESRHSDQYEMLAPNRNWRDFADWTAAWSLQRPTRVTYDNTRNTYCYSRAFRFTDGDGNTVKTMWARVISGKTSQRLITMYMTSKSGCTGIDLL